MGGGRGEVTSEFGVGSSEGRTLNISGGDLVIASSYVYLFIMI